MPSLNLRRAAVAAALVFADCCWFFFRSRFQHPIAGSTILTEVVEAWILCGMLLGPPLTVLAPIVLGARMVARQHVRAGGADPFERVRRWVAAKRWIFRTLHAGVALCAMSLLMVAHGLFDLSVEAGVRLLGGVVLPALAVVLALRAFGGGTIAPLVQPAELERKDADGYRFSAVAVTTESRAAVGLLAVLTVGIMALIASTSDPFAVSRAAPAIPLGYCVVAVLMAYAFQRASRIAVGLDGVRVRGSSRSRFHAYRDLDGVDVARGGDVLLLRQGEVALRLQLHGEDAARRCPIVERLRAAIARAHAPEAVAQRLAEAATPAVLARAARGDGDYRSPAASRDALWEVVEAPSAGSESRVRAARSLATCADGADRARLRFAAERCADPKARQALARIAIGGEGEEIGGEGEEEEDGRSAARAPALRRAALEIEEH